MTPFYNRNKRGSYPKQDIQNEQQSTWKATNLQELKPKKNFLLRTVSKVQEKPKHE